MAEASEETVHHSVEEHSKLFRDLLLGFVKVHVLYHAGQEPIYGAGITSELDQHGYHLSPGTLYPLLHSLEAARFLEREDRVVGGKVRKYYRTTTLGRRAFAEARRKATDLVREISSADLSDVEDDGEPATAKANANAGSRSKGR